MLITCGFKSHYPQVFIKNKIFKTILKKKKVKQLEIPELVLKLVAVNQILNIKERQALHQAISVFPTYLTKDKKICLITGRNKGNYPEFKMSRHNLKENADKKMLSGFKKAA